MTLAETIAQSTPLLPEATVAIPFGLHPHLPIFFNQSTFFRGRRGLNEVYSPFPISKALYDRSTKKLYLHSNMNFALVVSDMKEQSLNKLIPLNSNPSKKIEQGVFLGYSGIFIGAENPVTKVDIVATKNMFSEYLSQRYPSIKLDKEFPEDLAKSLYEFYDRDFSLWEKEKEQFLLQEKLLYFNQLMSRSQNGFCSYSYNAIF